MIICPLFQKICRLFDTTCWVICLWIIANQVRLFVGFLLLLSRYLSIILGLVGEKFWNFLKHNLKLFEDYFSIQQLLQNIWHYLKSFCTVLLQWTCTDLLWLRVSGCIVKANVTCHKISAGASSRHAGCSHAGCSPSLLIAHCCPRPYLFLPLPATNESLLDSGGIQCWYTWPSIRVAEYNYPPWVLGLRISISFAIDEGFFSAHSNFWRILSLLTCKHWNHLKPTYKQCKLCKEWAP